MITGERYTQREILQSADPGWKKSKKTGHNESTVWYENPERVVVRYYDTSIITIFPEDDGFIVFNNGWYPTVSTHNHMRKALDRLSTEDDRFFDLRFFYVHQGHESYSDKTCVHYKDEAWEFAGNDPLSLTWKELANI